MGVYEGRAPQAQILKGQRAMFSPAFVCCVNVLAAVFLQRIVVPLGDSANVSVQLPLAAASIGYLFWTRAASVDVGRLAACLIFLSAAICAQVFGGNAFSIASLALLIAIYILLPARVSLEPSEYTLALQCFQYSMVAIAFITLAQYGLQLAGSPMPILEDFIPEAVIVKDFVYLQEVLWESGIYKANGIFMLEPSFLSQFLALALIIEFWCFRRMTLLMLFSGVLVLTFSGTGMLLASITLFFMLLKRGIDTRLLLLGAGAACVLTALIWTGWFTAISGRLEEFGRPDASASVRFQAPFERVYNLLVDANPHLLAFGSGAGTIEEVGYAWNPPVKVFVEYGGIVCLVFCLFLWTVFGRTPVPMLSLAFALEYLFFGGGALLQPPIVFAGFFLIFGYTESARIEPD